MTTKEFNLGDLIEFTNNGVTGLLGLIVGRETYGKFEGRYRVLYNGKECLVPTHSLYLIKKPSEN